MSASTLLIINFKLTRKWMSIPTHPLINNREINKRLFFKKKTGGISAGLYIE